MRTALLGALFGAGLVVAAVGATPDRGEVFAQRTSAYRPTADSGLIALSTVVGEQYQQLTVIDPKQRVMSVYHVELATGDVELKCVRTIHWDLQMMCYNGKGLLPQEIQSLQELR